MRPENELQLSDGPATKSSEESTMHIPQGAFQPHTNGDQQEYEVVDQRDSGNSEQLKSEYANIPETEKPYDLPLTGYMSPTTTGEYSQLTRTYENHQVSSAE